MKFEKRKILYWKSYLLIGFCTVVVVIVGCVIVVAGDFDVVPGRVNVGLGVGLVGL